MKTTDKKKECFEHIKTHWKLENYRSCINEWNSIQQFISKNVSENIKDSHKCKSCGTFWKDKKFISEPYFVCCSCDTHVQPYLCNPINTISVLMYIKIEYYKYIFPIYSYFKQLDDPYDIFNESSVDVQLGNCYISFKEECEYGISIIIFNNYGEKYISLFLKYDEHNIYTDKKYYISSFYYDGNGLMEKIYSNRSEYFINDIYYSNKLDDKIDKIIKQLNELLIGYKFYPKLLDFIQSDEIFCIFSKEELNKRLHSYIFM